MRTRNTIYLSDLFTVPTPERTGSTRAFLRKCRVRRLLWAALPYCIQALGLLLTLGLMLIGLAVFALGLWT